jgi:hypothetical protein
MRDLPVPPFASLTSLPSIAFGESCCVRRRETRGPAVWELLAPAHELLERRTVRLSGKSGRGAEVSMDGFEIDDGGVASKVEEVLSDAEVARTTALLAGQVGEGVLDLHPFA